MNKAKSNTITFNKKKDYVLGKYDIRLADLKQEYEFRKEYDAKGVIRLPISEFR